MRYSILDLLAAKRPILFDGGLGTEIIRRCPPPEHGSEVLNLEAPSVLREIHADYFAAGSDVVSTNSFGGSRIKLSGFGLGEKAAELNLAAAKLAVAVRPEGKLVAGSIGPTGAFLEPLGEYTEEMFTAAFLEQALALAEGGVDLFVLETQYDVREALCALKAARKAAPGLPVIVTMTFKRTPRGYYTFMGEEAAACVKALEAAGVDGLGANCTLVGKDMADLVGLVRPLTKLPLLFQPNAGQPVVGADGKAGYDGDADCFAEGLKAMVSAGADMVGGCCGTGPEHIRAARRLLG